MTKRLFIAIPLTADVKSAVSAYIQKLNLDVIWSKPDNLHITLAFLGDTSEEKIPAIKQAINMVSQNNQPFTVSLSKIGYFRNSGVLWIGIDTNHQLLKRLANSAQNELVKKQITFYNRHAFTIHLTIGRNKKKIKIPRNFPKFTAVNLPVVKIVLFESQLTPTQTTYVELHTSQL